MRLRLRHATVLVAALAGLTACSSAAATTISGPRKITFVVANAQLNFSKEMSYGFSTGAAKVSGVESSVIGPDIVDGQAELDLFNRAVKTSPSGVSLFTLSPDLFAVPLRAAAKEGIPLIAVDNPPPPNSDVTLFVGNDNYHLGQMLADQAIAKLPAGSTGTIVLGTSAPGVPVLDRRVAGIRDELRRQLPKVTLIGPFDTKQETAANYVAWDILVRANPDALAFLGTGDADGWNLATIRRGTHGRWLAGAFDLDPRSLAAVRTGDLLLVSPEHFLKGAVAGRIQATHAKNNKALPKGWIYTPGLAVTLSNVDAIVARQASLSARQAWFDPLLEKIMSNLKAYTRPLNQAG